ncbi:tRNA (adenosine(37)-N6)-threonylcarbamoyltransferase complex ATPase subunit type 1 TsaE [Gloeomargarita sp.]
MVVDLPDAAATVALGQALAAILPPGATLLLQGDLGSGKTTLVQGIALGLGIMEPVTSPTFTLVQEYPEGRIPLYHLDLYRLTPAEVAQLHPEIYWQEFPPGIVAIEWPERLPTWPATYVHLAWEWLGVGRRVQLTAQGTAAQSWLAGWHFGQAGHPLP